MISDLYIVKLENKYNFNISQIGNYKKNYSFSFLLFICFTSEYIR